MLKLPKIYISSRFDTNYEIEKDFLEKSGCQHRCFSFAYVHPSGIHYSKKMLESLKACEEAKIGIMMDSGAASLHVITSSTARRGKIAARRQGMNVHELQQQMYDDYIELCRKDYKKWDFYVTLDFIKHQPTIFKMQKQFLRDGLRPLPMYHGDHGLEWLKKYKDLGFNYIGISRWMRREHFKHKRYFLDKLFNYGAKHSITFHGMAVTSMSLMTMYPWKTVDSSTWSKNATIGNILFPNFDRNIIYPVHISKRASGSGTNDYHRLDIRNRSKIQSTIEELGFNLKELIDPGPKGMIARHIFNGYIFSHLDTLGIDLVKAESKRVQWEELVS